MLHEYLKAWWRLHGTKKTQVRTIILQHLSSATGGRPRGGLLWWSESLTTAKST